MPRYYDTIALLGIPIDNLDMEQALNSIFGFVDAARKDGRARHVATANVDFVVNTLGWNLRTSRHPQLLDILRRADLVTADGMPLVWVSHLLGKPLKERVAGSDMVALIAERAAKTGKSVYFLGGKGDVAKRASVRLKELFPDLNVAGYSSPFVHVEGQKLAEAQESDREIVAQINRSGADILLIAFGSPKQEIWFARNRNVLDVGVAIGIGATFDFIVGEVQRAPAWMQKTGLEWIHRIGQDPGRLLKRYLNDLVKFGTFIWPAILQYQWKKMTLRRSDKLVGARQTNNREQELSTTTLILPSRLDSLSVRQVREATTNALQDCETLIVDVRNVEFIDSSGIGYLIGVWKQSRDRKRKLFAFGFSDQVKKVLKLNRAWDIYEPFSADSIAGLEEKGLTKTQQRRISVNDSGSEVQSVRLSGRIDAHEVSRPEYKSLINGIGDSDTVIDLSETEFIDSAGIGFLVSIQRKLAANDHSCIIFGLTPTVRQVFCITRLDTLFKIVNGRSEAYMEMGKAA